MILRRKLVDFLSLSPQFESRYLNKFTSELIMREQMNTN